MSNVYLGLLYDIEVIDARASVSSSNLSTDTGSVSGANLSIFPHVKCELLKAYMWLLPGDR